MSSALIYCKKSGPHLHLVKIKFTAPGTKFYVFRLKCLTESKLYLCEFHRKQTWERWANSNGSGLEPDERSTAMEMMSLIAVAETEEQYNEAVNTLKTSHEWKKSKPFQHWFQTKWLSSAQVCYY